MRSDPGAVSVSALSRAPGPAPRREEDTGAVRLTLVPEGGGRRDEFQFALCP